MCGASWNLDGAGDIQLKGVCCEGGCGGAGEKELWREAASELKGAGHVWRGRRAPGRRDVQWEEDGWVNWEEQVGRQEWGVRWGDRRRVLGEEATVSHPAAQSIPTPALHNKHTVKARNCLWREGISLWRQGHGEGQKLSEEARNFTVKARKVTVKARNI